jgi:hypothetical protein
MAKQYAIQNEVLLGTHWELDVNIVRKHWEQKKN